MKFFVAINFSNEVNSEIAKHRFALQNCVTDGNFTKNENFHITLAFLGECDEKQLVAVKNVLAKTKFSKFSLIIDKMGSFINDIDKDGHVVWSGLSQNEQLNNLQKDLRTSFESLGFEFEYKEFNPHITLCKNTKLVKPLPQIKPITFEVNEIELMASKKQDDKTVYVSVFQKKADLLNLPVNDD